LIILGIDPGLLVTGYGCIELKGKDVFLIEGGVIRTNPKEKTEHKLVTIFDSFNQLIKNNNPEHIAVEEIYSHYAHPLTAVKMGYVRGLIYLVSAKSSIPISSYSATKIKKGLTGNGRAGKESVQRSIQTILHLKSLPYPPDVSDALAAALCHANIVSRKVVYDY